VARRFDNIAPRRRSAAALLALVSICFALYGCELIADFDRGKIPVKDSGAQPEPSKDAGNPPAEEDAGGEEDAGK
jgi:hypothetical protein